MRKFTFLAALMVTLMTSAQGTLNETAVFDFTNNAWNIPGYDMVNFRGVKTAETYTDGEKSITINPTANKGEFYYENGYLRIAKPGSKIVLPAFDFAVEKIEVVGHASATSYPNVDMNVYVGKTAVSTACVGSTATYTYEIVADKQEAGNVYELVIGSKGGNYSSIMYITGIKVYPRDNKLEAPVITPSSGVYVSEQTVNVHSVTADIKGVTNVTYYYTTDGNEPTVEDEETTDGVITISESCTLKVIVELTYGDKTYISASSSAEYIISEEVTYPKLMAMVSGKYFIAANNTMALPFSNGILPTKSTNNSGDNITDAAYYAYSFECAGNEGFYIKDANGLYLTASATSTKDEIKTSTTYHNSAWNIAIEEGIAKIRKDGYVLAYDGNAIVAVKEENTTEATVYPSLYGISNPPSVFSYSPNSYTTELKTIYITFSEAVRIEGITSADQFPIYAEGNGFHVGMGNWTLSNDILTIMLEYSITTNGNYYIIIPAECIVSKITGKKPTEDIRIDLVVYNEDQTSIEDVKGESRNVKVIYDLQGRKIEKPSKGGIYIVNGKKVLVK